MYGAILGDIIGSPYEFDSSHGSTALHGLCCVKTQNRQIQLLLIRNLSRYFGKRLTQQGLTDIILLVY